MPEMDLMPNALPYFKSQRMQFEFGLRRVMDIGVPDRSFTEIRLGFFLKPIDTNWC